MKKFIKKLAKKSEGFTLVELIVVIAILGILAGVAVPAYSGYLTKAKQAADIVELDAIKTAAQSALAKKGAVTAMSVTETDSVVKATAGGTEYTLTATVDTDTYDEDFKLFLTGSTTGTISVTLDTGSAASWSAGTWTITGT